MAGDYIVVGCKGRVWAVSRSLSPAFRSFAAAAKKTELELGVEPTAKVVSDDGTQNLSIVKLQWDLGDGSVRTLMYVEARSGTSLSESVEQKVLCNAPAR